MNPIRRLLQDPNAEWYKPIPLTFTAYGIPQFDGSQAQQESGASDRKLDAVGDAPIAGAVDDRESAEHAACDALGKRNSVSVRIDGAQEVGTVQGVLEARTAVDAEITPKAVE